MGKNEPKNINDNSKLPTSVNIMARKFKELSGLIHLITITQNDQIVFNFNSNINIGISYLRDMIRKQHRHA